MEFDTRIQNAVADAVVSLPASKRQQCFVVPKVQSLPYPMIYPLFLAFFDGYLNLKP